MGHVYIQEYTTEKPISLIGEEAGICWNADVMDEKMNFKRGLKCLQMNHGRPLEFPQVYMIIDGYSARMIRELYTHIGGMPTRLQASTRYIDYEEEGFEYVVPPNIEDNLQAYNVYCKLMGDIQRDLLQLKQLGILKEDCAMGLPLGMKTKAVVRTNLRNLIDMSHQRLCTRAYWEYRMFMKDLMKALSEYSEEWNMIVKEFFKSKCDISGFCNEASSCGKHPKKGGE